MTQTLTSSTTTPLTPPKLEEDRLSWLRLFRSQGVGSRGFTKLLLEHGSADAALAALPELAATAGVRGYAVADLHSVAAEWRAGRRVGARLVCRSEPGWPELLEDIADPPPLLWVKGRQELLSAPSVALIGARNASSLGLRMARSLAEGLGQAGLAVVSGLARGIDAEAHRAALPTGTVAVLGGGIDTVYPKENARLQEEIAEVGCLLSEQPMGLQPQARHFPRRNRLISGLARALVVIEAAAKSGSLGTARTALDQGREVMAVPGHPFDPRAAGANMLIRDGAALVRGHGDVLAALEAVCGGEPVGQGYSGTLPLSPVGARAPAPRPSVSGQSPERPRDTASGTRPSATVGPTAVVAAAAGGREALATILDRLGPTPTPEDQLLRDLGCSASHLAPALLDLELDGRIQRHAGGLISRT